MWAWENVRCGHTENYYEASLLTLHLEQVLKHWNTEREALIQGARALTEQFRRKNSKIKKKNDREASLVRDVPVGALHLCPAVTYDGIAREFAALGLI